MSADEPITTDSIDYEAWATAETGTAREQYEAALAAADELLSAAQAYDRAAAMAKAEAQAAWERYNVAARAANAKALDSHDADQRRPLSQEARRAHGEQPS